MDIGKYGFGTFHINEQLSFRFQQILPTIRDKAEVYRQLTKTEKGFALCSKKNQKH